MIRGMGRTREEKLCRTLVFFVVISAFFTSVVVATELDLKVPDEGNTQILKLNDGSSLVGTIQSVSDTEIEFKTDLGTLTIAVNRIIEITEVSASSIKKGKYWYPNPNQTRLFLGPTGRLLKKGEGYFSDAYIFFPGVAYGLTDNITIGGGLSIFPGADADEQLYYLTPKIGLTAGEKYSFAVSALIVRVPFDSSSILDEDDKGHMIVGALFGVATYGTENHSVTLGLGYGYADDDWADKPVVLLGGEIRISRRLSFVSENWIFPGDVDPMISGGVRLFGEQLAVDLGFFSTLSTESYWIPYVDFVWNFRI